MATVQDLIDIAKRDKATAFFGDVYLLDGKVVDRTRFMRESGMAHLVDVRDEAGAPPCGSTSPLNGWRSMPAAEAAQYLASVEHVDHFRNWAPPFIEMLITLADLSDRGREPSAIADALENAKAQLDLFSAARNAGRMTPSTFSLEMFDRFEMLLLMPGNSRCAHYARIAGALRSAAML